MNSLMRYITPFLSKRISRFLISGLIAYTVTVITFELVLSLRFIINNPHLSMIANLISSFVSIICSYFLSKRWVYKIAHKSKSLFILFFVVNILCAALQSLILYISHYVLGFTSIMSDNISSLIVGVAIATIVRYLSYTFFIFNRK